VCECGCKDVGGRQGLASRLVIAGAASLLAACAGRDVMAPLGRAPEQRQPAVAVTRGVHAVERGDTLYAIAWQHGLDYRDLARWNGVPAPYTIYPGQQLRITRPAELPPMPPVQTPAPAASGQSGEHRPATSREAPPSTERRLARPGASASGVADVNAAVKAWAWPARGKLVATFGRSGGKGIDIAAERGAAVSAAAPGRVVYSGSGLRGYGRLIIIKHNKRYLSAYAHNERLHVKEGDDVVSGQRIADMGSSGSKSVKLHFEIRRDGKPVDPIRYLPR
jgi:lipoprotein NlpD